MSDKIFSPRQQNITTWILLFVILILVGSAIFLKPDSGNQPAAGQTTQADQPSPQDKVAPPTEGAAQTGLLSDSVILALQVGVGAGLLGYLIGYKRGQHRAAKKSAATQTDSQEDTPFD